MQIDLGLVLRRPIEIIALIGTHGEPEPAAENTCLSSPLLTGAGSCNLRHLNQKRELLFGFE